MAVMAVKKRNRMSKTQNQITFSFWLVKPEKDYSTPEQMRALGERGVYAPAFISGEKKMINMIARFDIDDPQAVIQARAYALRNMKAIIARDHGGGRIWGLETWINGQKLSTLEKEEYAKDC